MVNWWWWWDIILWSVVILIGVGGCEDGGDLVSGGDFGDDGDCV